MFLKQKNRILAVASLILLHASSGYTASAADQLKIRMTDDIDMYLLQLPAHSFRYQLEIPAEESMDSSTQDTIPAKGTKDILISRYDKKNILATLIITDPAIGNRLIWSGKLVYDQSLHQLTYTVIKQDDLRYQIKINLKNESVPQFQIDMISI